MKNSANFIREGFLVVEMAENYEQVLSLVVGDHLPPLGVLDWSDALDLRTLFRSRKDAHEAIRRTEHYAKAFGKAGGFGACPRASACKVVPVRSVTFRIEEGDK